MWPALLFAAGAWNFSSQRVSLVQYSNSDSLVAAERDVAQAQAKVERDMARAARIRRSNSLLNYPMEGLFNGPESKQKNFPSPTDVDKATLESPDQMYTRTPRVKRHNRFGPNNRYDLGKIIVCVGVRFIHFHFYVGLHSSMTCADLDQRRLSISSAKKPNWLPPQLLRRRQLRQPGRGRHRDGPLARRRLLRRPVALH